MAKPIKTGKQLADMIVNSGLANYVVDLDEIDELVFSVKEETVQLANNEKEHVLYTDAHLDLSTGEVTWETWSSEDIF